MTTINPLLIGFSSLFETGFHSKHDFPLNCSLTLSVEHGVNLVGHLLDRMQIPREHVFYIELFRLRFALANVEELKKWGRIELDANGESLDRLSLGLVLILAEKDKRV